MKMTRGPRAVKIARIKSRRFRVFGVARVTSNVRAPKSAAAPSNTIGNTTGIWASVRGSLPPPKHGGLTHGSPARSFCSLPGCQIAASTIPPTTADTAATKTTIMVQRPKRSVRVASISLIPDSMLGGRATRQLSRQPNGVSRSILASAPAAVNRFGGLEHLVAALRSGTGGGAKTIHQHQALYTGIPGKERSTPTTCRNNPGHLHAQVPAGGKA